MPKHDNWIHYDVKPSNVLIEIKSVGKAHRLKRARLEKAVAHQWLILHEVFSTKVQPSSPSTAFLSALLPASVSEDVIANLHELFVEKWVPRHGERKARWIWRTQAASLILRQWIAPVLDAVAKVRGLKLF